MIGAAHGGTLPALGIDAQLEVETLPAEHPEAVAQPVLPSRLGRPDEAAPDRQPVTDGRIKASAGSRDAVRPQLLQRPAAPQRLGPQQSRARSGEAAPLTARTDPGSFGERERGHSRPSDLSGFRAFPQG